MTATKQTGGHGKLADEHIGTKGTSIDSTEILIMLSPQPGDMFMKIITGLMVEDGVDEGV